MPLIFKKLRLRYEGIEKNLTLIGEIHLYNRAESEWAENLLKRESFDILFLEGAEDASYLGNVGKLAFKLSRPFLRVVAFILRRNYPKLTDFAKQNKIPIKYLEEGTSLPLITQLGLLLLFGSICILIILIIRSFILNPLEGIRYILILLITIILLFPIIWHPRVRGKLERIVPANVVKRDMIMCKNLKSYIKNVEFNNAIVLVGLLHLASLILCLNKEPEFKISEKG